MEIPEGKSFELIAAGTYNASLVKILDLGTQKSNNPNFKDTRKIRLYFEVANERTEEGDPFVLFREYNFTNNKDSHLMKDLVSWLSLKTTEGFDIDTVLGRAAQISVAHSKDGKYANITAVVALVKGSPKLPKPITALSSLYLTKEAFDENVFNALSEKMKQKIAGTKEYAEATVPVKGKGSKPTPAAKGKKK